MSQAPPPEIAPVMELARDALDAALYERYGDVEKAVQAIGKLPIDDAIVIAMLGWIDTAIGLLPHWQRMPGRKYKMVFQEVSSTDDDKVKPGVRWAGEMIIARATDDMEAFEETLYSCQSDKQFGEYVVDLLMLVATNLRPVYEAAAQVRATRNGGTNGG